MVMRMKVVKKRKRKSYRVPGEDQGSTLQRKKGRY